MALKINNKAGIRATFQARPDLKEVHILPSGDHFFNLNHAEQALQEGQQLTTLQVGADELEDESKEEKPAKK